MNIYDAGGQLVRMVQLQIGQYLFDRVHTSSPTNVQIQVSIFISYSILFVECRSLLWQRSKLWVGAAKLNGTICSPFCTIEARAWNFVSIQRGVSTSHTTGGRIGAAMPSRGRTVCCGIRRPYFPFVTTVWWWCEIS